MPGMADDGLVGGSIKEPHCPVVCAPGCGVGGWLLPSWPWGRRMWMRVLALCVGAAAGLGVKTGRTCVSVPRDLVLADMATSVGSHTSGMMLFHIAC